MITCRKLAELLMEYIENELAQDVRRQVEEHLKACPPCVVFVETYQVTIHLSRHLSCSDLPDSLRCRCEKLLQAEQQARPD